jgi:CysZ protein
MMLIKAALAAWRQVFSPPLRNVLWKSLALTIALLALIWFVLTRVLSGYLAGHPLSADYPVFDTFAFFFAGAGLLVALTYLIPAVSAIVAGYFLDDVAERVEATDFPSDPPGQALPAGKSLLYGLRFAGLSLLVNLAALILFFVPVVNIGAFFVANAYLLGREYFELAAGRFHPIREAATLRARNRGTVLLAGAMLAAFVMVPGLNLLTPLFGVTLMVHVHKRLAARAALPGRSPGAPRLGAGSEPG